MSGKKRTLDKDNGKLKLNKIAKKQKLQEQGITLIALVVTIIILLILAGVTLNIALSDNGLFGKAKKAAEEYKQAQSKEEDLISQFATQMYSEYVGEYVTGYEPIVDSEGCTIGGETSGTGTSQQFTTDDDMKWRIWDFDGNTLRLISDKPTEDTLQLKNVNGYNNGVWAMNEICSKCYSNDENGVTVRNLRRSDIEAVSNYDYTKYEHEQGSWQEVTQEESGKTYIHYGEEKNYTTNYQSPKMWSDHDRNWTYEYKNDGKATGEKSCSEPWEQAYGSDTETGQGQTDGDTKFKQSYYSHDYKNNEFDNSRYYDLIFKKGDGNATGIYWLAGRYVNLYNDFCWFGLHRIDGTDGSSFVNGRRVFDSKGVKDPPSYALRPIVSIDLKSSGYKLVKNTDGSGEKYKITKEGV